MNPEPALTPGIGVPCFVTREECMSFRAETAERHPTWQWVVTGLGALVLAAAGLAAWTVSGAGKSAEAALAGHEAAHAQELKAIDSRLGIQETRSERMEQKLDRIGQAVEQLAVPPIRTSVPVREPRTAR